MSDVIVLSTTNLNAEQLRGISAISPRVRMQQVFCRESSEVAALLPDVEVLLTQHGELAMDRADRLRWVQMQYAGVEHLAGQPLLTAPVAITTSSGIHVTPIAEFVVGQMVILGRKLPLAARLQRGHSWPEHPWRTLMGRELRGETMGILGYGSIGREVGRLAQSLGMRVIALSASGRRRDEGYRLEGTGDAEGQIPAEWYEPAQLHGFLAPCGFVVVATPLTPQTRGLIGSEALRAMRRDAYLLNIARGEVVQEKALIAALREGQIAGAALDVFEQEPLPAGHPFYELDNVIITPHMAAMTPNYNQRLTALFGENLQRYLAGERLLNVVDTRRGY